MQRLFIVLVLLGLLVGGCSYIRPSDRTVIATHYLNAVAIEKRVAADEELPDWVKRWWWYEAETWRAMVAWSDGDKPSPLVPYKKPEDTP